MFFSFNPKKAAIIILKIKCIPQLENIFKKWQDYLMCGMKEQVLLTQSQCECVFKNIHLLSTIFHCCLTEAWSDSDSRIAAAAAHRPLPLKQDGFLSSSELAQHSHRWHRVCAFWQTQTSFHSWRGWWTQLQLCHSFIPSLEAEREAVLDLYVCDKMLVVPQAETWVSLQVIIPPSW